MLEEVDCVPIFRQVHYNAIIFNDLKLLNPHLRRYPLPALQQRSNPHRQ